MVSGGIYWKTGKLQAGQVNQAAVSAARRGAEQREGAARSLFAGRSPSRAQDKSPAPLPALPPAARCPKSTLPDTCLHCVRRCVQAIKILN